MRHDSFPVLLLPKVTVELHVMLVKHGTLHNLMSYD